MCVNPYATERCLSRITHRVAMCYIHNYILLIEGFLSLVESGRIELHSVPVQNTFSEEASIHYLDNAHLHSLAVPFRSVTPLM